MHRRTFKLPFGLKAEFVMTPEGGYQVEWSPGVPPVYRSPRAKRKFIAAYLRARDVFAGEVATILGEPIAVIDVGTGTTRVFGPQAHL